MWLLMTVKVDAFLSKKIFRKKIITGIMLNKMRREVLYTYDTGFTLQVVCPLFRKQLTPYQRMFKILIISENTPAAVTSAPAPYPLISIGYSL